MFIKNKRLPQRQKTYQPWGLNEMKTEKRKTNKAGEEMKSCKITGNFRGGMEFTWEHLFKVTRKV